MASPEPPLVLLGATGHAGRALARLLLAHTTAPLVLAGRDRARLEVLAHALEPAGCSRRVACARVDAAEPASVRAACEGARMLVVTASISEHATTLARACLAAGCDWFDLVLSERLNAALRALGPEIAGAGRCFVTQGGFHPGLPAVLVRAAAPCFDALERALVHSVIQVDWSAIAPVPSTVDEFVDELADARMELFREGAWREASWISAADFPVVDFGPPFGRRYGAPMAFEEMHALPGMFPALRETGFYVGGFNWCTDWIVMPLALVALRVWPAALRRPSGALLLASLRAFSRPPFGTVLLLRASGHAGGAPRALELRVDHPDGYALTALPALACIEQMLDGTLARPGLHLQALAVEPGRLLRRLAALGATVTGLPNGA